MKELSDIRNEINDIDVKMASLFEKRMVLAGQVAQYKKEHQLPVFDQKREQEVKEKNTALITASELKPYYQEYIQSLMDVSKHYQRELLQQEDHSVLGISSASRFYSVHLGRGILKEANKYFDLQRKVLIVTDSGIPTQYIKTLESQCQEAYVFVFPQGEENKSLVTLNSILEELVSHSFSRKDCLVALGGGVVGDITGLAASLYMRGIAFYNIPTTLLSMVDSSIGGKTAIDFLSMKNIVGTFYPPYGVLIDVDTLKTLSDRLLHEGLAESIKMSLTHSRSLFELIRDSQNLSEDIESIIYQSLKIKKQVVEGDEKESGNRQVLNFGHTLGHAFEAYSQGKLYHGEAVSIGMTYMVSDTVKQELLPVLKKYQLPVSFPYEKEKVVPYLAHDKKASGEDVNIVVVESVGTYEIKKVRLSQLEDML